MEVKEEDAQDEDFGKKYKNIDIRVSQNSAP